MNMITDLDELGSDADREADLCIIGAGTAGLTLLRELFRTTLKIIVLESGGQDVEERTQNLYRCDIAGLQHRGHMEGRVRVFGGTSTRWGGQLLPLTSHDIEARDWIGAQQWPVKYADLAAYYRRVEAFFGVDDSPYDYVASRSFPVRSPDLDPSLFAARYAKWPPFSRRNLASRTRKVCVDSDHAEVILHANVFELIQASEGGSIVEARAKSLSGRNLVVRAKHFVVSMGTLETVRLLLASNGRNPGGIGNHSGWLGRNFQDHLSIRAAELRPRSPREFEGRFAPFFVGSTMRTVRLELTPAVQRERQLLSCFGQMLFETPGDSGFTELRELLRRIQARHNPIPSLAGWSNILRDLPYMFRLGYSRFIRGRVVYPSRASVHLQVDVEQRPNPESRVTLAEERDALGMPIIRLDWQIGDSEKRTLQEYVRFFRENWERLGFGEAVWNDSLFLDGEGWLAGATDVFHQTGGTAMSDHPSEGVVDPQLRVHGVTNLFLASCSVFPSAGSANPTFTLLALTIRLADHIKEIWNNR